MKYMNAPILALTAAVALGVACKEEMPQFQPVEFSMSAYAGVAFEMQANQAWDHPLIVNNETLAWYQDGEEKGTAPVIGWETPGQYKLQAFKSDATNDPHQSFIVNVDVMPALDSDIPREPLLLKVSAGWCPPCGGLEDFFEQIKDQASDPDLMRVFGIWQDTYGVSLGNSEIWNYADSMTFGGWPATSLDGLDEIDRSSAAAIMSDYTARAAVPAAAKIDMEVTETAANFLIHITIYPDDGVDLADFDLRVAVLEDDLYHPEGTKGNPDDNGSVDPSDFYQHIGRYLTKIDLNGMAPGVGTTVSLVIDKDDLKQTADGVGVRYDPNDDSTFSVLAYLEDPTLAAHANDDFTLAHEIYQSALVHCDSALVCEQSDPFDGQ